MFWAVAVGLAVVSAALIVLSLLGRGGEPAEPDAASDVQVYRDQLDEVERDLARGTLSAEEAGAVRTEVARRLLEANRAARSAKPAVAGPPALTGAVAVLCALVVAGGGLGTYWWLGAPGYPDLPLQTRIQMADDARANRPSQAEAEAQMAALGTPDILGVDAGFIAILDQLRTDLTTRPDDLRGHEQLARDEALLGNFTSAVTAQRQVIALKGEAAVANDFALLAVFMINAAGGFVSPEAEAVLTRVLQMDNANGTARFYSGLLYANTGRPDLAFQLWRGLLEAGPESAPWIAPIRAQIAGLADLAGVNYDIPPVVGPDPDAIAAAEALSPEERNEMIRGMVSGLAQRLATQGGPPEDWARLIGAYGVLGEQGAANDIFRESLNVFADNPEALRILRRAAQDAEVAQ